jgi:mRNA-degrading endonuclease RelE of RelBE toxin-antitoxin system
MSFLISDTFIASLAKLTGDEQKAVKTTAFDLQLNPESPGLQFHRLLRAKDPNFWSVRVNLDIRLIVHKTATSLLLCYVDHHDAAYRWAELRKLERHPKTGAAQLVEVRETVREIEIPRYVDVVIPAPTSSTARPARYPFADLDDDGLLGYGVPTEWLDDVRGVTEASLFDVLAHLPSEAAEALLEVATGGTPRPRVTVAADEDAFAHPDARRHFAVMTTAEQIERALAAPWDTWAVFLHPDQQDLVERRFSGPARVAGSAGTGKTIVALHRAVYLTRAQPRARVLLTTFNHTLADALRAKLDLLVGNDHAIRDRVTVDVVDHVALQAWEGMTGRPAVVADDELLARLMGEASAAAQPHRFSDRFLLAEWREVVDEWQVATWEDYRDIARLGRKTRLPEEVRAKPWSIFQRLRATLDDQGVVTTGKVLTDVTRHFQSAGARPSEFVVVDEAQDLGVGQLRFLAALVGDQADGLFFAGDLGQRIFRTPFSWRSLGVDVRGRSFTLRVNYRTSQAIRQQADRLLGCELADVDGNVESRAGTISTFKGQPPVVEVHPTEEAEQTAIAAWLKARIADGVTPTEMAVFVRSEAQLPRAYAAITAADAPGITVTTMHQAKGLEFRAVVVAACDDEVLPLQTRIESVTDNADLEDVYETERHLLYVACTRARDWLLVTGVGPGSEFLDDMTTMERPA